MKKNVFLFLMISTFIACKKNSDAPPVVEEMAKVKDMIYDNGRTYHFGYSTSGQVISIEETTSSGNIGSTTFYELNGNQLTETYKSSPLSTPYITNFTINNQGYIVSATKPASPYYRIDYSYNSSWQIVEEKETGINGGRDSVIKRYYYTNGVCDSIVTVKSYNSITEVIRFEYYPDKIDNRNRYFFFRNWWGKTPSTKALKTEKLYYVNRGVYNLEYSKSFDYTYNTKNQITAETITWTYNPGSISTENITYTFY